MSQKVVNHFNIIVKLNNTLELDHKQKSLLVNTKARHIIRPLEGNTVDQFIKLFEDIKKAKLQNYFIFGTIETLNKVIEAVSMSFNSF